MSAFWQAKIWGLLHDPALKALHFNPGRGLNSFWQDLAVMQEWRDNDWNPEKSGGTALKHIHLADYITSASDRAAIGSLSESLNYAPRSDPDLGLEISHLLSGEKYSFKLRESEHQELNSQSHRANYLNAKEQALFSQLIKDVGEDILKAVKEVSHPQKVFWWLWRCLPVSVCQYFGQDDSLLLMPAETRLPDSSIWSHASLTASLAGALAGYNLTSDEIKRWPSGKASSRPYLATFSFSPVQEFVKSSRKMRDFWAGSWILHYLSAKVSWKLAQLYGPDSLVYPSLFQQPLIDYWLLAQWPDFKEWIKCPCGRQLLTAGFPNVLVIVLPQDRVKAAMQTAKQTLNQEWQDLSRSVFNFLQTGRTQPWISNLHTNSQTWDGWLNAQWQTYWSALPIGEINQPLKSSEIYQDSHDYPWINAQNRAYNLSQEQSLFNLKEIEFLQAAAKLRWERTKKYPFSASVGSWWPYAFDQTRFALAAIKSARNWVIPTAFGPRSTISGVGPVVHPDHFSEHEDWITEGDTKKLWQARVGLFDGIEELNATETVKRVLHKVLPFDEDEIATSYPDLTAGVAGYLKVNNSEHSTHFHKACQAIVERFPATKKVIQEMRGKWGIPWADSRPQRYHSRLLNAGWLVEDTVTEESEQLRTDVQKLINNYYPINNPASLYLLAAGDGDNMSAWLKGKPLEDYNDYVPNELKRRLASPSKNSNFRQIEEEVRQNFQEFLKQKKRMGPSTHSALSRALLDFSNQLAPYLTEERYAGRLIYSGGDDILAYTNLWEWDNWLWDIRQCFRGFDDPINEFNNQGDYWQWRKEKGELPNFLSSRPLFTMGRKATISFGVVIAHHSVPLAIALENLWSSEDEAKKHIAVNENKKVKKDAVQVRVLYSNGNILKATCKFDTFNHWRSLLSTSMEKEDVASLPALFEQAASVWKQHPAPLPESITCWAKAFCVRRELFKNNDAAKTYFQEHLANFLNHLQTTTLENNLDREIQSWLKLGAFVLRNREITLRRHSS